MNYFKILNVFQDFKIVIFQDFELFQDFKIVIFQDFELFQDFKCSIFQDFWIISRFQYFKMKISISKISRLIQDFKFEIKKRLEI